MVRFINEHPFITLFIVETICSTAVSIVRILKGAPDEPAFSIKIGGNKGEKEPEKKSTKKMTGDNNKVVKESA
jgi:hypothetical protein